MSLSDTPESIIELLEEVIEEATEDKENFASKAKTRRTMAYRAVRKGSDEEVFTPKKFLPWNFSGVNTSSSDSCSQVSFNEAS